MMRRCHNPAATRWAAWGGRGITVCERWHDFAAFEADILRDIGPCPPGRSIDRIDNDRGYEPGNVQWATHFQQAHNRRLPGSRRMTEPGLLTTAQTARILGVSHATVMHRAAAGVLPYESKLPGSNGAWLFRRSIVELVATQGKAAAS